jgi:hypothetical protein
MTQKTSLGIYIPNFKSIENPKRSFPFYCKQCANKCKVQLIEECIIYDLSKFK